MAGFFQQGIVIGGFQTGVERCGADRNRCSLFALHRMRQGASRLRNG